MINRFNDVTSENGIDISRALLSVPRWNFQHNYLKKKLFSPVFLLNMWCRVYFTDQVIIDMSIYVLMDVSRDLYQTAGLSFYFDIIRTLTTFMLKSFLHPTACAMFLCSLRIVLQNARLIFWINFQKQMIHFILLKSEFVPPIIFEDWIFSVALQLPNGTFILIFERIEYLIWTFEF